MSVWLSAEGGLAPARLFYQAEHGSLVSMATVHVDAAVCWLSAGLLNGPVQHCAPFYACSPAVFPAADIVFLLRTTATPNLHNNKSQNLMGCKDINIFFLLIVLITTPYNFKSKNDQRHISKQKITKRLQTQF